MAATFDEQYQAALQDAARAVQGRGLRQALANWSVDTPAPDDLRSDAEKEVDASLHRFGGRLDTLRGVGRQLFGDVEGAQRAYADVAKREEEAAALDSDVSVNPGDWEGVGDALAGLRKAAIGSAPDMALSLAGAGVGRQVARRAATRAEARQVADQSLWSPVPGVARARTAEAADKAARAAVRRDPAAMGRVARAGRAGALAGGTLGGMPGLLAEQNEFLQENQGQDAALAAVGGAAVGSVLDYLPAERLLGRAFSNPALKQALAEANPSLMRQLAARATTAGKRAVGQGLLEGGTEALQAAVLRAGQKVVDDNIELFSREALNDYVANFVLGGMLGTSLGAAVDVPQGVAGATADVGRWAWDRSGGLRAQIRENLAKPWFRGQEPMPMGGPQPAADGPSGPAPGGAFASASEAMQRAKETLASGFGKARSAAAEGFQRAADALRTNADLDARAAGVMDELDAYMNTEGDSGPIGLLPGMVKGQKIRNWALSKVDPEYLAQIGDGTAGHLGNALNHLARGAQLTAPQRSLLVQALQAGAITAKDYDVIRGIGPVLLERERALSRTAGDELSQYRSPQFGQDRSREVVDEDEDVDTGIEHVVGLGEQRGPDPELPALDRANSARQGMRAAAARGDAEGRAEQRQQGIEAFNEGRQRLLQGLTFDENRSSPEAARRYDRYKASPEYVELRDKVDKSDGRGKVMRGQLVNLAQLIKRQQDAMRREGMVDDEISPVRALMRGLSELQQLGAAINPDTLTKGDIIARYERNGKKVRPDEFIMRLTDKTISALKREFGTERTIGPQPRDLDADGNPLPPVSTPTSRRDGMQARTEAGYRERAARGAAESRRLDEDFANQTRYETEDTREPDDDKDRGALRARETPPGEDAGDGRFIPSNSPVSSVSFSTPHQKQLDAWRAERRKAGNDVAALTAINQRYGEIIGAAELARESEAGTISPQRLERELARLKDPSSGLALRYLERAARGRLEGGETTASVRHMRFDAETPAKGQDTDDWVTSVDDEGNYRGSAEDLQKRADRNRRTAKLLLRKAKQKSHPQAEAMHEANKARMTTEKAREVRPHQEPSMGDGLGSEKKKPAPKPATEAPAKPKGQVGQRRVVKKGALHDLSPEERAAQRASRRAARTQAKADVQAAVEATASTKAGEHDFGRETKLVNDVLKALGYEKSQVYGIQVKAHPLRAYERAGRFYFDSDGNVGIYLGNGLKGRERVEVLMHELGHALVAAELSRASGLPLKELFASKPELLTDGGEAWMRALSKANPELFNALKADYDLWRAQHNLDTTLLDLRASRSGPARVAALRRSQRATGLPDKRVGDNPKQVGYNLSMNEWLADNISRALLQNKTGQSLVEKFFGRIARQLRRMYDLLFKGKDAAKWAPAPSVDAWVKSLFDANVAAVRAKTKRTVSKKAAENTVKAAAHTARRPRPRPRDDGGQEPPEPPAPPGGPTPGPAPDEFNALRQYVRDFLPPEARNVLHQAFSTAAANAKIRQLFAEVPGVIEALDDARHGLESRIAAGYITWRLGLFNGGPKSRNELYSLQDRLLGIFNLAGNGDYAQRIMSDMATGAVAARVAERRKYDFRKAEARVRGGLQAAVNAVADVREKIFEPVNRVLESNARRMMNSGIPAYREIGALLYRPQGATGGDRGMLRDTVHTTALFAERAARIMEGLSPLQQRRVMDLLQRAVTPEELKAPSTKRPGKSKYSPQVQKAVREVRKLMDDSLAYMREAGVRVGKTENYFPVMLDIRDDAAALKLERLLRTPGANGKPKFEAAIRELFSTTDAKGNKHPSKEPFDDLVKNLVDGARDEPRVARTGAGAPNFRGANRRLMRFIYEQGSPEDIKAFAALQTKNPAEVFARYFEPMVKRAEYARRFGDDGKKLEALLERMKAEGATEAQIAHARGSVEAALGVYGQAASPVLSMISPALAERFSGPKTRATIDGLQAYQNARLLPLSLLSSLADPAGLIVRSGGDFGAAWRGFREGLRTLYNGKSREEMQDMLRMLGASSDMATQEALNQLFGGAGSKLSQKVNEFVFRWNGMAAWTRATRYMALSAAHEFLLKHARGANEHSARYLAELGVKAGDIKPEIVRTADGRERVLVKLLTAEQRKKASAEARAADDRVRQALMDFVDGAILRPNSQQSPLWHSDPFMGLVTQYKSFAYAFYDQIVGRIDVEMRNGNAKVLLAAAAYLPIVIMAEMLRNVLQGDTEDTEDWGPDDWVMLGAERAGFISPKLDVALDSIEDVQRGRLPGTSQIGATPSQARNMLQAFSGRRDLGKEFESALPGSALYRKWNDGARAVEA